MATANLGRAPDSKACRKIDFKFQRDAGKGCRDEHWLRPTVADR